MAYESLEGASRICLIYQVVRYQKDEDSEEYTLTYYEALNQTLLTQKYRGSPSIILYHLEFLLQFYKTTELRPL